MNVKRMCMVGVVAMFATFGVGQPAALANEEIVLRSGTVNGLPGTIPTQGNVGDVDDNITYSTNEVASTPLADHTGAAASRQLARKERPKLSTGPVSARKTPPAAGNTSYCRKHGSQKCARARTHGRSQGSCSGAVSSCPVATASRSQHTSCPAWARSAATT